MNTRHPNKILNIALFIVIMFVQSACATATSVPPTETPFEDTSTPEPNSTPTDTPTPEATPTEEPTSIELPSNSPIPIMVMPFYDVEGLYIDVGNYSEELKTSDLNKLTLLAEEMARQKSILTPEQMFVLSIRLHDLGDKDNSVYWFYDARFRQMVFEKSLDPNDIGLIGDPSFELPAAYNAFSELAGGYINAYAGCDLDNWINIVQTVKENNPEPPDLEKLFPGVVFIERNQWEQINNNVGAGLDEMANYISENREEIVKIRAENDLDAQFCDYDNKVWFSENDAEMNAAIQNAKDTLPLFIQAMQTPKPSQTIFAIKAEFPYGEGSHSEFIWISDLVYENNQFEGIVTNEPSYIQSFQVGDSVIVQISDVADWMIVDDNKLLGGYTIILIRDRMTDEEREVSDNEIAFIIPDEPALP